MGMGRLAVLAWDRSRGQLTNSVGTRMSRPFSLALTLGGSA